MNKEIQKNTEIKEIGDAEKLLKKEWYKNKEQKCNKNYYEKNKAKILEGQKTKVKCNLCNRSVIKPNY